MKKSILNDNRGLTLIELLIGISILAIIVVPLLHTFVTGANTSMKSRTYSNATEAAQNIIEQIQSTSADTFFSNSGSIYSGAQYYNSVSDGSSGYSYTVVEPNPTVAPESSDKKHHIGIKNVTSGGSVFDAMITLDANDDFNNTDVSISNDMSAVIGMSNSDNNVLAVMRSQYGSYFIDPLALTLSGISRNITIAATKESSIYFIEVIFTYSGIVTYTEDGITYSNYFNYTETGSARVNARSTTDDGDPAFSVYLFFKAYYSNADRITINNLAGSDFNVFLVDVTDSPSIPATYLSNIEFKSQYDYKAQRVFTNITPSYVDYKAYNIYNPAFYNTLPTSGNLVETKKLDRKFLFNVSLFESGSNFSGKPILSIDSNKLD